AAPSTVTTRIRPVVRRTRMPGPRRSTTATVIGTNRSPQPPYAIGSTCSTLTSLISSIGTRSRGQPNHPIRTVSPPEFTVAVTRPKSTPATATTARAAAVMIAGTGGRTIAAPTADTTDITGRRALNAVVVWPVHGTAGPRGGSDVAGPAAVSGLRDRSSRAPRPAAAPPIRK